MQVLNSGEKCPDGKDLQPGCQRCRKCVYNLKMEYFSFGYESGWETHCSYPIDYKTAIIEEAKGRGEK